ncbi:MAG: serine/threonine protein kinase [Planctomycetes bacterium]|nr:serine/threonine protein kinase [Planctomycetota bacterium]
MSSVPPLDMNGQSLGGYTILERIGAGGMGTVYKAKDRDLDRFVAIKVLSPVLESDPVCIERFKHEARSIAALSHPNLMHIYSVGSEKGLNYFAMEYVDGIPLSKNLSEKKHLPLAEAIGITAQILGALDKVHRAGIVHRDLKPGNIMLDRDGRAVVLDFGLAKDTTATMGLTGTGTIMGTPDYMAPEQIEGEDVGPFTDVYALGVMLYEMLANSLPFHRKSAVATMRAHCEEDAPPITNYRSDIPPSMRAIITRMITREPSLRYQSVGAVASDLLKVCHNSQLEKLAGDAPASISPKTILKSSPSAITKPKAALTKSQSVKKKTMKGRKPVKENPEKLKTGHAQMIIGMLLGAVIILLLIVILRPFRRGGDDRNRPPAVGENGRPGKGDGGDKNGGSGNASGKLPRVTYLPEGDNSQAQSVYGLELRFSMKDGRVLLGLLISADEKNYVVERLIDGERETIPVDQIESIIPWQKKRGLEAVAEHLRSQMRGRRLDR